MTALVALCTLPLMCRAQLDLKEIQQKSRAQAEVRKAESNAFHAERLSKWEEFIDRRSEEWAKMISERDVEWSGFLSDSEWTLFEDFLVDRRPQNPKPDMPPKTVPVKQPTGNDIPEKIEPFPVILEPENQRPAPKPGTVPEDNKNTVVCKPAIPEQSPFTASFGFYGSDMQIAYDTELSAVKLKGNGQKEIAKFWKDVSETNYTPVVERLLAARDEKHLNGYAYYLLVSDFAKQICAGENHVRAMTWFLLVRSGYDVKIGYHAQGIILLLPTEEEVYDKMYLTIDGRRFYLMTDEANPQIYTYSGEYSAGHDIDFSFSQPMLLGGRTETRNLHFDFRGKNYSYSLDYNADLIDFYKDYPKLPFEQYFNAAPSVQLRNSINASLKPFIEGMDKLTALNFLLQAVQLSFDYKTDQQQFGFEKYFYSDEVLAYPYCDCEDRSVFFTYLVHELLGYDVIGTEFVNHMASAVALDIPVNGTNYNVKGQIFTIADPTYINAEVGQCMPDFCSASPKIHFIDFAR